MLGELRGGVAPGGGGPFWLEGSGVGNRRKSVPQERNGGLQWGRGHCRHRGWFWGGFLAGEQRGAAQAATADLRHGEADERTGWKQGFAHFWCLSKVH